MTGLYSLAAGALGALLLSAPLAGAATVTWNTLNGEAPLVIAHRGASGYLPEHTLAAYELAIKMGADIIEPDVQLTSDGHMVVMHDFTLTGTTNVREVFPNRLDYRVSSFTLEEIKQLTVTPRGPQAGTEYPGFTPSMENPYEVPTLEETLDWLKTYNAENGTSIGVYPESKNPTPTDLNVKIVDALVEKGYTDASDKVYLQSFYHESVKELSELLVTKSVTADLAQLGAALVVDGVFGVRGSDGWNSLADIAQYATGLGLSYTSLNDTIRADFIAASHDLGLKVHAYTFRPLTDESAFDLIQAYLDDGLDGFFTDYTDRGRQVVDAGVPVVPVPAALPLLLGGIGLLGLLGRRRARAVA